MTNITDELASWVLRINTVCNEKDAEIARLRATLQEIADDGIEFGGDACANHARHALEQKAPGEK